MRLVLILICLLVLGCTQVDVSYEKARIVETLNHDARAYTQGLEMHQGMFWESTGQYGQSSFRIWDPQSGHKHVFKSFPKVFIEGVTLFEHSIYLLTWKAGICFRLDPETLEVVDEFKYEGQGWGLTHDGQHLIMSNGSDQIQFRDPDTFELLDTVQVRLNGRSVGLLNELEYYRGEIWANIYGKKVIVRILPDSGDVSAVIECLALPPQSDVHGHEDVLNGIAINPEDGKIYLTGKYWSKLYRVELEPQERHTP